MVYPAVRAETFKTDFNRNYIFLVSAITAMGGILFGFDLVTISGAIPFLSNYFSLNEVEIGWAVGCINLGCAIGALLSSRISDAIGRKKSLILCAILFAITGIGTGWAGSFGWFSFFRVLSGVAVGAAALACPMYIAEISPASVRGRMVSFYQLAITFGILLAYVSNYLWLNSGEDNWRWMFTMQSVPALFFLVGLFLVDESPRWLAGKGRSREALRILIKVGGPTYAASELHHIEESFGANQPKEKAKLLSGPMRIFFGIGVLVAVFSQASGVNSLFSYAPEILTQAGVAKNSAFLQSALLGITSFLFTFIAIFAIDRTGRRKLLLYGSFLLFCDALFLAASFWFQFPASYILIGVLAFIGIFAATLGPVLWVMLSEIFPNRIRAAAMGWATLSLWIANFFTIALFPVMKLHIGLSGTFLVHGFICVLYFVFIKWWIPETKGRTLEEIEHEIATIKSK